MYYKNMHKTNVVTKELIKIIVLKQLNIETRHYNLFIVLKIDFIF